MSKRTRRRRRSKPRANISNRYRPPGQIQPQPQAQESLARIIAYGNGQFTEETVTDAEQIHRLRTQYPNVWVDLTGFRNVALIEELGRIFNLHPLALEDAVNQHQIAKCEEYDSNIFFVMRMLNLNGQLTTEQMSMFIGAGFVITLQEIPGDCFDPVRDRLRRGKGRLSEANADFLAYSILDSIIDSYFPIVDSFADQLDSLEDQIARSSSIQAIDAIHVTRNDLLVTRRAIRPLRDALGQLQRGTSNLVSQETRLFLRDCFDHSIQLIELLETYRELCSDLREYHISMISYRMNEIMKVLTVIATIFIPLSFIASVYGMNFDTEYAWNMPELSWPFGYMFAWLLMLSTASTFIVYFWRKGWILQSHRNPSRNDH
ncbi:MAG TPA: magnesium/cobalt transporter CorA [Pirellulaceae bacterium]|nr:magnesium/cobalt transporter CorA [Pirellulaceae bacterium]